MDKTGLATKTSSFFVSILELPEISSESAPISCGYPRQNGSIPQALED